MRAPLAVLAGLVLAGSLLAGCGDDSDGSADTATEPTESASVSESPTDDPSATPSVTPSVKPVGVGKTCRELYRPPGQWMPRAIEFVHGSPSAEDASDAADIVAGLAEAEGRALGPLAVDIETTRVAVDTQQTAMESGSDGPDVKEFDGAVNRLARHCEFYNG